MSTNPQVRIHRADHTAENKYLLMSRSTAQNRNLSFEARGMLSYILSKPITWTVQPKDLQQKGCGRDKVYRILNELEENGYIKREFLRESGTVKGIDYTVYEEPFPEKADTALADTEKPDLIVYRVSESTEEENTFAASAARADPKTVKPEAKNASSTEESGKVADKQNEDQSPPKVPQKGSETEPWRADLTNLLADAGRLVGIPSLTRLYELRRLAANYPEDKSPVLLAIRAIKVEELGPQEGANMLKRIIGQNLTPSPSPKSDSLIDPDTYFVACGDEVFGPARSYAAAQRYLKLNPGVIIQGQSVGSRTVQPLPYIPPEPKGQPEEVKPRDRSLDSFFDAHVAGLAKIEKATPASRIAQGWRAGKIIHGDKEHGTTEGLIAYECARQGKEPAQLDYEALAKDTKAFWRSLRKNHPELDFSQPETITAWWDKMRVAQDKAIKPQAARTADPACKFCKGLGTVEWIQEQDQEPRLKVQGEDTRKLKRPVIWTDECTCRKESNNATAA
jgi:hypothetical protein